MKIACIGDIHAHVYPDFDRPTNIDTGSERLNSIKNTLLKILEECKEKGVDLLLFAGDAFHTRGKVLTVAFNALYEVFMEFSNADIGVVMIAGNHDQADNAEIPEHSLFPFSAIPNVEVLGDTSIIEYEVLGESVEIVCVPYNKSTEKIIEFLDDYEENTEYNDQVTKILLGHLGISGAKVGALNYPMQDAFRVEDLRPDIFDYVVLGHYHKPQKIGGYDHMFYCGAPLQHSFSDEGTDNGYYLIDTDIDEATFCPVSSPKFITVDPSTLADEDIEKFKEEGHYVRLKVTEDNVDEVKEKMPEGVNVQIELQRTYEETMRVDVKVGMGFEELVSTYAKEFSPESESIGLDILREAELSL